MKKQMIIIFSILAIFSINSFSARIKIARICYVNTKALLKVHPSSRNIIDEMQRIRQQYESEIRNLEKKVRELEKKVKNEVPNMSRSDARELIAKLEAKREALSDEIARRNEKLKKIQREKLQPVYRQILNDIKKYASSLGYNIVIDSRYVLIGSPDLDITEALKRIFMSRR